MEITHLQNLPTPFIDKKGFPWTEGSPPQYREGNLPKITIVTPSFNQGEYIEETIRSILLQGYPNLEFIIIDGGSSDNTVEIIKKYEKWITYWVSEPDKGQSDAINKGLKLATGDVFNWINSDDILEPNALWCLSDAIIKNPNSTAFIGKIIYFGEKLNESVAKMTIYDSVEKTMVFSGMTQQGLFYATDVMKKLGGVNAVLYFCMDAEFWLRYLLNCENTKGIVVINQPLAKFRIHDLAKSQNSDAHYREWLKIHINLLSAINAPPKVIEYLSINPMPTVDYSHNWQVPESLSKSKIIAYSIEWFLNTLYYHYAIRKLPYLYFASFQKQPFLRKGYFYVLPIRLGYRKWKIRQASKADTSTVFTTIYRYNKWGDIESISGLGSTLNQTIAVRQQLPAFLAKWDVKSLLDAPCGDLNWIKQIELPITEYIGADIVEDLINHNKAQFKHDVNKRFMHLNIIEDELPKADVLLCRDCLVHFSKKDLYQFFRNLKKSKVKYLLTTTFPEHTAFNKEMRTGRWQPLNLEAEPLSFPKPLDIINEESTEWDGAFKDKSLALWLVSDLPNF
jgi:glycosyltransferase involved in cell wall biosynthesis